MLTFVLFCACIALGQNAPAVKQGSPGAQAAGAPQKITAEEILDRAAAVVSTTKASLDTVHINGVMELTSGRIMSDYETSFKAPDNEVTVLEEHGHGVVKFGRDKGKAWFDYRFGEVLPVAGGLNGISVFMLAHALRAWHDPNWRKQYGKVELVGRTKEGSGECILIRLWPKIAGDVETRCFDVRTLLLSRLDGVQRYKKSPGAPDSAFVVAFVYSDYVDVQGFKVPRKFESRAVGLNLDFVNTHIDINKPIPDSAFVGNVTGKP